MNVHNLIRQVTPAGIRKWYKEHEARLAAMSPAERAAYDREMERRAEETRKHIEWLDYCAKHKVYPKGLT